MLMMMLMLMMIDRPELHRLESLLSDTHEGDDDTNG